MNRSGRDREIEQRLCEALMDAREDDLTLQDLYDAMGEDYCPFRWWFLQLRIERGGAQFGLCNITNGIGIGGLRLTQAESPEIEVPEGVEFEASTYDILLGWMQWAVRAIPSGEKELFRTYEFSWEDYAEAREKRAAGDAPPTCREKAADRRRAQEFPSERYWKACT